MPLFLFFKVVIQLQARIIVRIIMTSEFSSLSLYFSEQIKLMADVIALFTYANFLEIYPWLCNLFSLAAAYMLSNHRVVAGRIVATIGASNWILFGYLTDQYAFVVANLIFMYIYASAAIKFQAKRDSYKKSFEEQEAEIERLTAQLNKRTKKAEKAIQKREEEVQRISRGIISHIKSIEGIMNNTPKELLPTHTDKGETNHVH